MKTKILLAITLLLSVSNVYSQLEVNSDGSITVSCFKVDGYMAGFTGNSGNANVSFGYRALHSNTSFDNTAIGREALYLNTSGYYNVASGNRALYANTSGYGNTAIGNFALLNNTTGDQNTATGGGALANNTTGSYNTANGTYSLPNNTTGEGNTANGDAALASNTTGSYNTADGFWSLAYNTTGSCNTTSGYWSLASNTTGSYNTAIGHNTNVSADNLSNITAIGYGATATASNQVRIGNSTVTSIGGYAPWSNISDGRIKKNIRANVPGLAFINRLQPVTYNLDLDIMDGLLGTDKIMENRKDSLVKPLSQELIDITKKAREAKEKQVQTGFVAQDVEKIAKNIGYDFSGVDVDEAGIYGLRYAEFVVPLVKAVQELSEQNERLQEQVTELSGLVQKLLDKKNESGTLKEIETHSLK